MLCDAAMAVDCNNYGTEHKELLLELSSIAQHPMFAGLLHPRSPGLQELFADACKAPIPLTISFAMIVDSGAISHTLRQAVSQRHLTMQRLQ